MDLFSGAPDSVFERYQIVSLRRDRERAMLIGDIKKAVMFAEIKEKVKVMVRHVVTFPQCSCCAERP